MGKFKSGKLTDIFTERVMYPENNWLGTPKLTKGSSYYVEVTYFDGDGKHVENAVIHFNGNNRIFAIDSFSLTRADGTTINSMLLYDPDSDNTNLDDFIRVYDIPENDGHATVSGLNGLNFSDNPNPVQPTTNQVVVPDNIENIPMKTILDETYNIDSSDILYTDKLDLNNSTIFNSFVESAESATSSIMTSIKDIEGILSETQSDTFYSGTTAKNEINKLHTLSSNIEEFKTRLEKLEPSELKNRIEEYNEKYIRLKKLTRINLLQKRINVINNENILYENYSERYDPPITQSTIPHDTVYYEDNKYRVEVTYKATPSGSQINFNQYKMTVNKYIFLQYSTTDSYQTLEELIESVGQTLPYDKSRITED